jgi:cation transport regulator ChaC
MRSLLFFHLVVSFRFVVIVQNPGRVVTLIHQEDWAAFSGAVSCLSAQGRTPPCPLPLPDTVPIITPAVVICIRWTRSRTKTLSGVRCAQSLRVSFSFLPRLNPPFPFPDYFEIFADQTAFVGVAYTIDPAHATEVRAYLGTYGRAIFPSSEFRGTVTQLAHLLHAFHQITAKRYSTVC